MADKRRTEVQKGASSDPPSKTVFSKMSPLDILFDLTAIIYVLSRTVLRLLGVPARACYTKVNDLLSSMQETIQATTARVHSTALATKSQLRQAKVSTTSRLAPVIQGSLFLAFAPFIITYHAFLAIYQTMQQQVHGLATSSTTRAKGYLHIVLHPRQSEASRQVDLQVQYLRKQVMTLVDEVEARGRESRRLEAVVGELNRELGQFKVEVSVKQQEHGSEEQARLDLLANGLRAEIQSSEGVAAQDNEAGKAEFARLEDLSIRLQAELEDVKRSRKANEAVMETLLEKIKNLEAEKGTEAVVKPARIYVSMGSGVEETKEGPMEESTSGETLKVAELPSTSLQFPKTSVEGSSSTKDHRRTISFNGQHLRAQSEPKDVQRPSTPTRRVSSTSTTRSRRRSFITRVRSSLGLSPKRHSRSE